MDVLLPTLVSQLLQKVLDERTREAVHCLEAESRILSDARACKFTSMRSPFSAESAHATIQELGGCFDFCKGDFLR